MAVKLNPKLDLIGHKAAAKKKASAELWNRCEIRSFLLDSTQQTIAREFDQSTEVKHVVLCSRRLGKSWTLCTLAIEKALLKPNQLIKYLTTSAKAAKEIVFPLVNQLLSSCPETHRPEYFVHDSKWKFTNGSEILLHGVDRDGGESLRGQAGDFVIIDEAGFINGLDYLLKDVLMPMVIERNGRILMSSTPPRDADHDFIKEIAKAEKNKSLTKKTIYDCPRFTPKMLASFIEEAGGVDSETFRIEYMCEVIRTSSNSIVPEATDVKMQQIIVAEFPKLNYQPDTYVSFDVGFTDASVALFGYYDFLRSKICIQAEFLKKGATTEELAHGILETEQRLWRSKPPYKRISDVDHRLIADFKSLYNLRFKITEKTDKESTINLLRMLINDNKIEIHESCVNLIMQLKYGSWKTSSTGKRVFQRSDSLGHVDAIDSLLYLIRNVNRSRNPIPQNNQNTWDYWGSATQSNPIADKLNQAFRRG
jgi:hypothetical protein